MMRALVLGCVALFAAATAAAQEPTRFSVKVTGKGPDLILIPGLGSSSSVWDRTVAQLSPTHRVHAVQVLGFAGAPAGPNGGDGEMLPGLVEEIGAYAAKLEKPAIIGHSLGGLVAMKVAAAQPEKMGRLMIVDALPFLPLLYNPNATVEQFAPMAARMRDGLKSEAGFSANARGAAMQMTKTESFRAEMTKWTTDSDRTVFAKAMYEDAMDEARPLLPKIKANTTVLYAYDPAMGFPQLNFDEMYKRAYAGLAGVKLVRVDGSYHFIQIDQPEKLASEISELLK